jgi:hypothetical protein
VVARASKKMVSPTPTTTLVILNPQLAGQRLIPALAQKEPQAWAMVPAAMLVLRAEAMI